VLAAVSWWRGHSRAGLVLATLAAMFALAGLLVPGRLKPVRAGWMSMAHAISKVTAPIFLGIVYFVVLTPVGLVRCAFGIRSVKPRGGRAPGWIAKATRAATSLASSRRIPTGRTLIGQGTSW
jgi:hypothetical protein